ncbi:MAG: hypothetical protein OXT09_13180 [Myxococcales bacterium]|nr:hypothetical protein [Myxococcales bacterium]
MLSESRPFHGVLAAGLTPVGLGGVGLGLRPAPWSSVEVSLGMSTDGPQGASAGGLYLVGERYALGIVTGVSAGPYSVDRDDLFDEDAGATVSTWDFMVWSNTSLQIRHDIGESTAVRAELGGAIPLTHTDTRCSGYCDGAWWQAEPRPILGIGLEHYVD